MTERHIYRIKMFDHVAGGKELLVITVVGVFIKEDEHAYTLCWWVTHDDEDHNQEFFTIIKSAIIEVKDLGPLE
jgi:hypothetical protein